MTIDFHYDPLKRLNFGVLKGHGFSRAKEPSNKEPSNKEPSNTDGALAPRSMKQISVFRKTLAPLKGMGFSPYINKQSRRGFSP